MQMYFSFDFGFGILCYNEKKKKKKYISQNNNSVITSSVLNNIQCFTNNNI